MTGLTLVASSTDSHNPTSSLFPAEVGVGVGCPIRRALGQESYRSPSIMKKKNSPVWKERGACGIPLRYKRRTLPIERGLVDSFPDYELRTGEKSADICS